MPEIHCFRSCWGFAPGPEYKNWAAWFPDLKKQGYYGVEIDIAGLQDLHTVRKICDDVGLEISALIFSSWPQYQGARPAGLKARDHLDFYRSQLELAKVLRPVRINAQSGADHWPIDESVTFYEGTFAIDAEMGFEGKVCHETHRNRSLFSPYSATQILGRVPRLRITLDLSHWVVVCERLLNVCKEDVELLDLVIPHVRHIHCRIGTTQSSQCPDPRNPVFAPERRHFEGVWEQCVENMQRNHPAEPITFVPEYGPYPYHPFGSARDYSEVADTEGSRLRGVFRAMIESHAQASNEKCL